MDKAILQRDREAVKARQMAMAKNVARLTSKKAQKQQAHLLCESLKQSIKERA